MFCYLRRGDNAAFMAADGGFTSSLEVERTSHKKWTNRFLLSLPPLSFMRLTFCDISEAAWTPGAAGRSTDSTRQDKKQQLAPSARGTNHSAAILWRRLSFQRQTTLLSAHGVHRAAMLEWRYWCFLGEKGSLRS